MAEVFLSTKAHPYFVPYYYRCISCNCCCCAHLQLFNFWHRWSDSWLAVLSDAEPGYNTCWMSVCWFAVSPRAPAPHYFTYPLVMIALLIVSHTWLDFIMCWCEITCNVKEITLFDTGELHGDGILVT